MTDFFKKNYPILIVMTLAFATRFVFLGYPAEVVFDEVHFGKFVNAYFSNEYYFDIHPPLGKMLIAGFAKISGVKTNFDFSRIGEKFNNGDFLMLRFLPALFGALLPLIIYLIIKQAGFSSKTASLGSFFAIFDNTLLVQSKFILLDSSLLFFGFLSLYFFLNYRKEENNRKKLLLLIASVVLAALSFSIKWTALSFSGVIMLFLLIDLIRKKIRFKIFILSLLVFILTGFIIYYSVCWVHFKFLFKSGSGDAYMSPSFQKTLKGNRIEKNVLQSGEWKKFTELNNAMLKYNASITATHPNSSKWYQWPIGQRPVWYWSKNENGKSANIYLFGNLAVWWSVLIGIIFSVFSILFKKIRQKLPSVFWIFIVGYFSSLLPYFFINRIAFLYHYLPALVFGILILTTLYEKIFSPFIISKISSKMEIFLYFSHIGLCFLVFLIFSPLSLGLPMPYGRLNDFYQIFIQFIS